MERRVLFAIFASFLVIYLWQAFFVAPVPPPAKPAQAPAAGAPAAAPAPPAAPPVAATGATPVVSETAEREVRVETGDLVALFTNRGGRLKSWRLKHYSDQHGDPLELVEQQLPAGQPLPF